MLYLSRIEGGFACSRLWLMCYPFCLQAFCAACVLLFFMLVFAAFLYMYCCFPIYVLPLLILKRANSGRKGMKKAP